MNASDFKLNTKFKKYIHPFSSKVINVEGVNFLAYAPLPNSTTDEFFLICGRHSEKIIVKEVNEEEAIKKLKQKINKRKKEGFKFFTDWKDFARPDTLSTLSNYCGHGSSQVKTQDKEGELEHINTELRLLPKKKGIFYRGLKFYDSLEYQKFLEKHKDGEIVEVDSISSTSTKKEIAESFASIHDSWVKSVLIEIDAEALFNGENRYSEKEYLLIKGTKLKIKETKEVTVEGRKKPFLHVKMEKA